MAKPPFLRQVTVYENRDTLLLTGVCPLTTRYHAVEVRRPPGGQPPVHLGATLCPETYTQGEIHALVADRKMTKAVPCVCCCVYGFVRLVESWYLVVVTKAAPVATLHGHTVFTVADTAVVPVTYKARNTMEETRYKDILEKIAGNNLCSGFYFSFTYDVTRTVQQNMGPRRASLLHDGRDMYVWNHFALQPLLSLSAVGTGVAVATRWAVPIVHGYLQQKTVRLSCGTVLTFTLLARRSRVFAGTRYLRRGVDCQGYTANEVESEQVVTREGGPSDVGRRTASLVQVRGSVPLFWHHTNIFVPSPDIKVVDTVAVPPSSSSPSSSSSSLSSRSPSSSSLATAAAEVAPPLPSACDGMSAAVMHFDRLYATYGGHISVLNLVRTSHSGREVLLGAAYTELCASLTRRHATEDAEAKAETPRERDPLNYHAFDFHGSPTATVFAHLAQFSDSVFPHIGFFVQPPRARAGARARTRGRVEGPNASANGGQGHAHVVGDGAYVRFPLTPDVLAACGDDDDDDDGSLRGLCGVKDLEDATDGLGPGPGQDDEGRLGAGACRGLLQRGVLRTNCVDCLDRTNVGQFCFAKHVLPYQLKALGCELPPASLQLLEGLCTEVWADHGDAIAQQYGGSAAMHRVDSHVRRGGGNDAAGGAPPTPTAASGRGLCGAHPVAPAPGASEPHDSEKSEPSSLFAAIVGHSPGRAPEAEGEREYVLSGGAKNAVVAVQRYYSNISTDFERQQGIDLILGVFRPVKGAQPLWETDLNGPNTHRGQSRIVWHDDTPPETDSGTETITGAPATPETPPPPPPLPRPSPYYEDAHTEVAITAFDDLVTAPFRAIALDDLPCRPYPGAHRHRRHGHSHSHSHVAADGALPPVPGPSAPPAAALVEYGIAPVELAHLSVPAADLAIYARHAFPQPSAAVPSSGDFYLHALPIAADVPTAETVATAVVEGDVASSTRGAAGSGSGKREADAALHAAGPARLLLDRDVLIENYVSADHAHGARRSGGGEGNAWSAATIDTTPARDRGSGRVRVTAPAEPDLFSFPPYGSMQERLKAAGALAAGADTPGSEEPFLLATFYDDVGDTR